MCGSGDLTLVFVEELVQLLHFHLAEEAVEDLVVTVRVRIRKGRLSKVERALLACDSVPRERKESHKLLAQGCSELPPESVTAG